MLNIFFMTISCGIFCFRLNGRLPNSRLKLNAYLILVVVLFDSFSEIVFIFPQFFSKFVIPTMSLHGNCEICFLFAVNLLRLNNGVYFRIAFDGKLCFATVRIC